ncbi:hypothetical protein [Chitinophaga sp.]|uniref:hypothetical protein n=1 Tax=Chitinophaga sp. TaxID=1869181 RepID=UPI0031E0FE84
MTWLQSAMVPVQTPWSYQQANCSALHNSNAAMTKQIDLYKISGNTMRSMLSGL